jgi:hypothetical protein
MGRPAMAGKLLREWLSIDHPHYFHKNSYVFMVQKAGFEILNFEPLSTIRFRPKHMEIFAKKSPIPQNVSPEVGCERILSEIDSLESAVRNYRVFSLRYYLHVIRKQVTNLIRIAKTR